jgi:Flp pilus assembly protein TadG
MLPRTYRSAKKKRGGAVFSLEFLLILPIVLTVCFAAIEFSLLLIGMQRVQTASSAACRIATLPATDAVAQEKAMNDVAAATLGTQAMVDAYEMKTELGTYPGDPVVVEIHVPMSAAAPNLLKVIGFDLEDRELVSLTEMCKQ